MINFFHHGNNIGFSFNGVSGFILLFFLIYEVGFFLFTRTFTIHKIYLYIVVRRQLKQMIPKWWEINSMSFVYIHKKNKYYEVYIKLRRKFNEGWANDFIKVNSIGKIINSDFMNYINEYDQKYQNEIKQWMRNKALEDIGI